MSAPVSFSFSKDVKTLLHGIIDVQTKRDVRILSDLVEEAVTSQFFSLSQIDEQIRATLREKIELATPILKKHFQQFPREMFKKYKDLGELVKHVPKETPKERIWAAAGGVCHHVKYRLDFEDGVRKVLDSSDLDPKLRQGLEMFVNLTEGMISLKVHSTNGDVETDIDLVLNEIYDYQKLNDENKRRANKIVKLVKPHIQEQMKNLPKELKEAADKTEIVSEVLETLEASSEGKVIGKGLRFVAYTVGAKIWNAILSDD